MNEDKQDKIISEHMRRIGRIGGLKNKRKGPEYFKWVQSHRRKKEQDGERH